MDGISTTPYDVAVIGGGILGTATAMALLSRSPVSLLLVEKEPSLALHQSGRNSGVIHAGLYYRPGSLKANYCVAGREALYAFCDDRGIIHERCGKVVLATNPVEVAYLGILMERGTANGLKGIRRLPPGEAKEIEPHAKCQAALFVPETGIVDYREVTGEYARIVEDRGGQVATGVEVRGIKAKGGHFILSTSGDEIICKNLINCSGLQSDRVARLAGVQSDVRIVPFRGTYYELVPGKRELVKSLIYPVPDPKFPFLGAHFTKTVHGGVEAGPGASLALKREGYEKAAFSLEDTFSTLTFAGFWKLAGKYLTTGMKELHRSISKRAFTLALKKLVPEIDEEDLVPAPPGIRAQALSSKGELLDDFAILEEKGMIHVLNAPSPAATASIVIGQAIAEKAIRNFGLKPQGRFANRPY